MPTLSDVRLPRAVAIVRGAIARGRLHHALLLTGPRGAGKRDLTLAVAAALNCEAAPGEGRPGPPPETRGRRQTPPRDGVLDADRDLEGLGVAHGRSGAELPVAGGAPETPAPPPSLSRSAAA